MIKLIAKLVNQLEQNHGMNKMRLSGRIVFPKEDLTALFLSFSHMEILIIEKDSSSVRYLLSIL